VLEQQTGRYGVLEVMAQVHVHVIDVSTQDLQEEVHILLKA
jgi:hypothetical protein